MVRSSRMDEVMNGLVAGIERLTSSQTWQDWLKVQSRFHRYSFGNTLLIGMQCPDATKVAGFQAWPRLGRNVRRGEKAIWILAPVTRKFSQDDDSDGDDRVLVAFKPAAVFDLRTSSTDGSRTRRWATLGGLASSATLLRVQPHRTAWCRADEMMAWWLLRMVLATLPSAFMAPYRSSRCLAVSRLSGTFPRRGRIVPLICARYVRIVVGDRSRRSHSSSQRSRSCPKVAPTPSVRDGACFLGRLYAFLAVHAEAPAMAATAVAGGLMAAVMLLTGISAPSAAALGAARMSDPALVRAAIDAGNVLLETSKLGLAILVLAVACAGWRGLLDRRAVWVGLVAGAVLVASTLPPFLADRGVWQFGAIPDVATAVPAALWVVWLSLLIARGAALSSVRAPVPVEGAQ